MDRVKLKREIHSVKVNSIDEYIRVKVAYDEEGNIIKVKPEHADIERLARKHGLSLREVREKVSKSILEDST